MQKVAHRDIKDIPDAGDEYRFQNMCLHVYEEHYRSPGASHYGRRGQGQGGRDICLSDWTTGSTRYPGTVWIQCKYTAKDELKWSVVEAAIHKAAEKVSSDDQAIRPYLFIVATTAKTDAKLLDAYSAMRRKIDLPFEVAFHAWDELCNIIVGSDRLWELYGAPPGGMQADCTTRVIQARESIARSIAAGDFSAAGIASAQLEPNYQPRYGLTGSVLPGDVWKQAPRLRGALLSLYANAQDSHRAYDLLQYELDLSNGRDALACLAYLKAERITGHLRGTDPGFPVKTDAPAVAGKFAAMAESISQMRGPPDVLASLALLVVMESDCHAAHDKVLAMVERLQAFTNGTPEEFNARVAHAVVRFHYVMRHGWKERVRRYGLGDAFNAMSDTICSDDKRLNQPFGSDAHHDLSVAGIDPLAMPVSTSYPTYLSIEKFLRYSSPGDNLDLPLLAEQMAIYAGGLGRVNSATWPAPSHLLTTKRVVTMSTLAVLVARDHVGQACGRATLFCTEATFSKLLGYRAVLRAHAGRAGDAGSLPALLERVDRLVGRCVSRVRSNHELVQHIYVMPLYDTPPRALTLASLADDVYIGRFTVAPPDAQHRATWLAQLPTTHPVRLQLANRYAKRSDETSSACLLALHLQAPLLLYDQALVNDAKNMGIACEHPDCATAPWNIYQGLL